MTAADALTALAPIIGTGGIVSVLVAWLGYRSQAAKGRVDAGPVSAALAGALAGGIAKSADVELLAQAVSQLAGAITRSSLIQEYRIERAGLHEDLQEWLDRKEIAATLAALRAERKHGA